jgi:hypothetical protein
LELHGIAVTAKRDPPVGTEPVKILITYEASVSIRMMRAEKYLELELDTGSDFSSPMRKETLHFIVYMEMDGFVLEKKQLYRLHFLQEKVIQ